MRTREQIMELIDQYHNDPDFKLEMDERAMGATGGDMGYVEALNDELAMLSDPVPQHIVEAAAGAAKQILETPEGQFLPCQARLLAQLVYQASQNGSLYRMHEVVAKKG